MFGFYFDPMYVVMVILPGFVLSGIASTWMKSAFNRYSKVATRRGFTGAQAAERLMQQAGINDVRIVRSQGYLSDHYNPVTRTLALSEQVYGSNSVSAIGVACHEAGHALQHADAYGFLMMRSAFVPVVNFGSGASNLLIMLGFLLQSQQLLLYGVAAFALVVLFQLITLPVEFDASARAKRLCVEAGICTLDEQSGVSKVLTAAAFTYVAAFVSSLLTLLYFLYRAGVFGGGSDD